MARPRVQSPRPLAPSGRAPEAAADRFNTRYAAALADDDTSTVEELDLFRKDVGSFVRLYDFLSQIVNYADIDLEKRSRLLRLLAGRLAGRACTEMVNFSTVELTHIKHARSGDHHSTSATAIPSA